MAKCSQPSLSAPCFSRLSVCSTRGYSGEEITDEARGLGSGGG
jgi:hypothetical protein